MKNLKLVGLLASVVPLVESVFYCNSAPNTTSGRLLGSVQALIPHESITPYIGNFPESFALSAISGLVGDYVTSRGEDLDSSFLKHVGDYLPEISFLTLNTYFALGETILPAILAGTSDVRDVSAVVLSSLAGYALAKIGRTSGFNDQCKNVLVDTSKF